MEKLVRDLIPAILQKKGEKPNFYVAEDSQFEKKLFDKLLEEIMEFSQDHSIEEFADVMEVLESIRKLKKYTWDEIDTFRNQKRIEKGGFDKKLVLIKEKLC